MSIPPRLVGGPYKTPRVRVGGSVECARRGLVQVTEITPGLRSTDLGAPIAWPRSAEGAIAGTSAVVLCGDLIRALAVESCSAVSHYWGLHRATVRRLRRAVNAPRFNAGTLELWSRVGKAKLSSARAKKMGAAAGKRRPKPR